MKSQQKVESIDIPEKESINGAWVDVKLCTVKAKKKQQRLADLKNKKANLKGNALSSDYTELHYGNYE